ncbi:MAG: hypothetical protein V5789_10140 [Colwellia sp.]
MTVQLPIIINIHSKLVETFSKINSVCNKLEAQFNFQTLAASWYGDEKHILSIQLALETPASFIIRLDELDDISGETITVKHFSDDVICRINKVENQFFCYIAMTTSELELLELKPKLLASFIQVKLHKVLNLIAEQCAFSKI